MKRENKNSIAASRKFKSLYEALTNNTSVAIYETDADGKCLMVNQQWCNFAGISMEDALGDGWIHGLHPDDKEYIFGLWNQYAKTGKPWHLEYRFRTSENVVTWVLGTTFQLTNEHGEITGYLGLNTDITERKRTEEALKDSEESLRQAQEIAKVGSWEMDPITKKLIWSRQLYDILEVSPDQEPTFELYYSRVHPDDLEYVHNIGKKVLKINEAAIAEYRLLPPSGIIKYVATEGRQVLNEENNLTKLVGMVQDITERKHAEETLFKSEEYLGRIISSSNDCIKVLDLEGNLLSMSSGGQTLLEIEDLSIYLKKSWIDFWKGEDKKGALEAISKAKKGDTGSFTGFSPTEKDTPKWWEIIITPINDSQGNVYRLLAISRDITVRRQKEEELKKYHEHLEELVKDRTIELEKKNEDLEKFNKLFVGREFRIKELRTEVEELKTKLSYR